jgi:hypothetical protein
MDLSVIGVQIRFDQLSTPVLQDSIENGVIFCTAKGMNPGVLTSFRLDWGLRETTGDDEAV